MAEIIGFVSIKGGVGKTTVAMETASTLANHFHKRVLLVDANFSAPNIGIYLDLAPDYTLHDSLGGVPLHNAIYEAHGFDVVPASLYYKGKVDIFDLKKLLSKFKNRYDYIILDSSPNYEEMKPVIATAEKIFVVTSPDHVTLETSLKSAFLAKQHKTPVVGVIVNKIRSPKHEFNIQDIEDIYEIPVVAKIRDTKNAVIAMHDKKPLTLHSPNDPASKEICRLSSALCGESEFQNNLLKKMLLNISREKINRDLYRQKYYESQLSC